MTYAKDMPTDTALASELRTTVMRLARRLRNQRADSTLGLSQLAALGTLMRHGPLTPSELAAHERVQPPSMTRTVNGLEAGGYVVRRPHDDDRRQVLVCLTDLGRDAVLADRARRDAWLASRLRELTAEERAVLREAVPLLERIAER